MVKIQLYRQFDITQLALYEEKNIISVTSSISALTPVPLILVKLDKTDALFYFIFYLFSCMCLCLIAFMSITEAREGIRSELELQVVVSHHEGVGN